MLAVEVDAARGGPARPRRGPRHRRCSTSAGPRRPRWWSRPRRPPSRTVSDSGRCWRWRSTAATGRPTPWRRCGPCARRSSRGWASTRRRRCATPRAAAAGPGPGPRRGGCPAARRGPATFDSAAGVVGRSAALAVIGETLGALVERRSGGVLLISGEAGIGKSMLAVELVHRAREREVDVLVGRCHEADLAPPYWPWLPVLRELVADRGDRRARGRPGSWSPARSTRPTPTTRARPPPPRCGPSRP